MLLYKIKYLITVLLRRPVDSNLIIDKWVKQTNKLILEKNLPPFYFNGKEAWIQINNLKFRYLYKMNSAIPSILKDRMYEKTETEFIIKNLRENNVFFDIGCNLGWYSLNVANMFTKIQIHAFEPLPEAMEDFKKNVFQNNLQNKIIMNQKAVSDKNGSLFITNDHYASNYITEYKYANTSEVYCTTIDSYVEKNKIIDINIIKCDVEGKELSVINGAIKTLKKIQPLILIELSDNSITKFENRKIDSTEEVKTRLLELGYDYRVIDDRGIIVEKSKIDEKFLKRSFHNYIFYHSEKENPFN